MLTSEVGNLLVEQAQQTAQQGSSAIGPQPGSQEKFLETSADIAVYGGAAGAGKSYALLMEAVRNIPILGYSAVIFRRTYPQITAVGGMWDTSMQIYPGIGAKSRESTLEWIFPSGNRIKFAHMQWEKDKTDWDGAQIAFIGFDQLEHFTWDQFFYMLSRNRSTCGVRPYIRATCNPDPDHWLRKFMAWWIDHNTGLPIMERSGVIRWFVILNDVVYWADTPEELKNEHGDECVPKSFTFVPGNIADNKILLEANPEYLGNLNALGRVFRERLLFGNWNVRASAGDIFNRAWFEIVPAASSVEENIRYWDRASTEVQPGEKSTASWTAGVLMGKAANGLYFVKHVERFRGTPKTVRDRISNIASQDGVSTKVGIEGDPGQAGVAEAEGYVTLLDGYDVRINTVRESKATRAAPYSAQCEAHNVKIVNGEWDIEAFLNEHHNFDGTRKCVADQVDASSGCHFMLSKPEEEEAGTWGRG